MRGTHARTTTTLLALATGLSTSVPLVTSCGGPSSTGIFGNPGNSPFVTDAGTSSPSPDSGAPTPSGAQGAAGGEAPTSGGGGQGASGGGDGGASPSSAQAGSASGGQPQSADACGGCDDGDPCTLDTCVDGECTTSELVGVVSDGFTSSIEMERVEGTELVTGGDRFFLAVQGRTTDGSRDAFVVSVGRSDPVRTDGPSLRSIAGGRDVIGSVALAPTSAGELRLEVFAPIAAADDEGAILPVVFDGDLAQVGDVDSTVAAAAPDRYEASAAPVGAHASTLSNGVPFVSWPSPTGVTNYQFDASLVAARIDSISLDDPVVGLSTVSYGARQGIAFATGDNDGDNQVSFTVRDSVDGTATPVTQLTRCTPSGRVVRIDAEAIPGTDTTAITWSEQLDDGYVTHAANVACSGDACSSATTCSSAEAVGVLVQLDSRFVERAGESGVVYRPQAVSFVTAGASAITASVDRIDVESRQRTRVGGDDGDALIMGSIGTGDLPPLHVQVDSIDAEVMLVAWVQRSNDGPDVVNLERFHMCYEP